MSRLSLGNLPMPPRRYRIDLIPDSNFETEDAAQREDVRRSRFLRSYPGRSSFEQAACNRLALAILGNDADDHSTLASARVMRLHRIKIIGALWALCAGRTAYQVTLIPRGFSVAPEKLKNVNALKVNQWLRMTLARYAANSDMDGWISAYLEGEYNPETGMIQLHWHLIMTRSPTRVVIKRLREHSAFRREVGSHNNPDGIDVRVMVKRIDPGTLPQAISYVTKSAWYSKWRASDESNGRKTQRRKGRIPEPAHTVVLRWLDRWKLGDMAMILNLHVTKNGITRR